MIKSTLTLIALLACVSSELLASSSAELKYEQDYVAAYCPQLDGEQEVRLPEGVRVDCLSADYAAEFDWARKWYEGVTQALYYSQLTGKDAMLVLIIKDEQRDARYIRRTRAFIKHYRLPLELVLIRPGLGLVKEIA